MIYSSNTHQFRQMPETDAVELTAKQQQFNDAMELYTSRPAYRRFDTAVSVANISLQLFLLYRIWPLPISAAGQLMALAAAYLLTDFVNGLVHIYMDNNDRYDSIAGPLIANFHLHHKTPRYKKNNLLVVYFNETGSKVWLVAYLAAVVLLAGTLGSHPVMLAVLVYTGILSSVAEVSHYLCHSSTSVTAAWLAKAGLLLSKKHHAVYHLQDNANYAFLNGISDPLLNLIASAWFTGYKQTTDLHFAFYSGADGDSR